MKAGWEFKNLGDLCEVVGGGTPSKDNPAYYSGDIPWATVRDMRQEVITETEHRITATAVQSSATNVIPTGNVVIATRVGLGKVCLLGQDTAINQDLRGVVPRDSKALTVRFLFWWLKSIADIIIAEGTGATVQGVKLPFVKSLQVPVPPPPEQHRIVAILDEAFDGIATAKANAEKNLQNARALFESHLQSVFTERGEGWVKKTLDEVCVIGDGNHSSNYPRKEELVEVGVPFIRATNLLDGRVSGEDMRFLSPEKHAQLKKGHLKTGDILITNRGEIGKTAIVCPEYDNANLNSQIAWLRCRDGMNNRFLFQVLNSSEIQQHFASAKSGAALQQFTIKQLKALIVPLPSPQQQGLIVNELETLSQETQRLKSLYQQKLTALDDLKKSLLHQAFSGAL